MYENLAQVNYFDQVIVPSDCPSWVSELIEVWEVPFADFALVRDLLGRNQFFEKEELWFVLFSLVLELSQGKIKLSFDDLESSRFFQKVMDQQNINRLVSGFKENLKAGIIYRELIGFDVHQYLPIIYLNKDQGEFLYFQKYCQSEELIFQQLKLFLKQTDQSITQEQKSEVLKAVLYDFPIHHSHSHNNEPVVFDEDQLKALEMVLSFSFGIISGGPGTGKTTILVNLLRGLFRLGYSANEIILLAPTGLAVQRMQDSIEKGYYLLKKVPEVDEQLKTGCSPRTIHRFLSGKNLQRKNVQSHNLAPFKVVIIDEASMIDVRLMENLMCLILPGKTRLYLLGDKNQLPPIEAGPVFHQFFTESKGKQNFKDRTVILKKVYRSRETVHLTIESLFKNKDDRWKDWNIIKHLYSGLDEKEGCSFLELEQSTSALEQTLKECVKKVYFNKHLQNESLLDLIGKCKQKINWDTPDSVSNDLIKRILHACNYFKILSLVNKGLFGVDRINSMIHNMIQKEWDSFCPYDYCHGEPVMITKNNYSLQLFNGEQGIVLKDKNGNYKACFFRGNDVLIFPTELLSFSKPSFSITVHKSQGSEFEEILVIVPEQISRNFFYQRIIIYRSDTIQKKNNFMGQSGRNHSSPVGSRRAGGVIEVGSGK